MDLRYKERVISRAKISTWSSARIFANLVLHSSACRISTHAFLRAPIQSQCFSKHCAGLQWELALLGKNDRAEAREPGPADQANARSSLQPIKDWCCDETKCDFTNFMTDSNDHGNCIRNCNRHGPARTSWPWLASKLKHISPSDTTYIVIGGIR